LEDYQQRVIDERNELNAKIANLSAFLFSDASSPVGIEERDRMERQLWVMMEYSKCLLERILNF